MFTCPFRIQRLTLPVGAPATAITPPITCSSVTVSNRTDGDLRIISDQTGAEYGVVSSCFEERIDLPQVGSAASYFRRDQINFYLQADMGGLVVLTWT